MPSKKSTYLDGVRFTDELVGRFKIFGSGLPEFALPGGGVAIIGSLDHVGEKLARNDAARELLAELIAESKRRKLEPPTVMMLEACLEEHGIPITYVPFEELGIDGQVLSKSEVEGWRKNRRGRN